MHSFFAFELFQADHLLSLEEVSWLQDCHTGQQQAPESKKIWSWYIFIYHLFGISKFLISPSFDEYFAYLCTPLLCSEVKSSPAWFIFEINKVNIESSVLIFILKFIYLFPAFCLITCFIFSIFKVLDKSHNIPYQSSLCSNHQRCFSATVQLVSITAISQEELYYFIVGINCCVMNEISTILIREWKSGANTQQGFQHLKVWVDASTMQGR